MFLIHQFKCLIDNPGFVRVLVCFLVPAKSGAISAEANPGNDATPFPVSLGLLLFLTLM